MFVCRFFFFHLYESPKFLLSRGRQAEAVATVHGIAYSNGRKTWLTEDILNAIGGVPEGGTQIKLSRSEVVRRFFSKFSKDRIAPLFATKRIGIMSKSFFVTRFVFKRPHAYQQELVHRPIADLSMQRLWCGSAGQL